MELEFAMHGTQTTETYPISIRKEPGGLIVDWFPMMDQILDSVRTNEPIALISARFHQTLVFAAVTVAHRIGIENIVLSGGCFQNRYLLEHIVHRLQEDGFRVFWPQRIPPNDGGIAVGQIASAVRDFTQENLHVPGRSR